MIPNYKHWKLLTTVLAASVAVVLDIGSSKQASVQAKVRPAQTLEDRVARIREELEARRVRTSLESQAPFPHLLPSENESSEKFYSQWRDWSNWNDWANWSDWSNWRNR